MNNDCCICGNILDNNSADYLCDECEGKYGFYDDYEVPVVEPMRRRKKYDDENN